MPFLNEPERAPLDPDEWKALIVAVLAVLAILFVILYP